MLRHPLAEIERDPLRVIDEEADEVAPDDLGEQDLDFGLHLGQAGLDFGLDRAHVTSFFNKKAGSSPASQSGLPAAKSCAFRVAVLEGSRTRAVSLRVEGAHARSRGRRGRRPVPPTRARGPRSVPRHRAASGSSRTAAASRRPCGLQVAQQSAAAARIAVVMSRSAPSRCAPAREASSAMLGRRPSGAMPSSDMPGRGRLERAARAALEARAHGVLEVRLARRAIGQQPVALLADRARAARPVARPGSSCSVRS